MTKNRERSLSTEVSIREGHASTEPLFGDPMQVETVRSNGPGVWIAGFASQRTEQFRRVTLTTDGIPNLTIAVRSRSWRLSASVASYQSIQEMLCRGHGDIKRLEVFA